MNVVGAPRSSSANNSNHSNSSLAVEWYTETPHAELSLDDFEDYALRRLEVLKTIEDLKNRNASPENYNKKLKDVLDKASLTGEHDKISHFILRAAYCHTEDLRRWFANHEVLLMKFRMEQKLTSTSSNVQIFRPEGTGEKSTSELKQISNAKKDEMKEILQQVPGCPSATEFPKTTYYEVPFEEALELVSQRTCYVHKGVAYVPQSKVITILLASFRSYLSRSLTLAFAAFGPMMEEQGRIAPLLKAVHHVSTSASVNPQQHALDAVGNLTASSIDSVLVPHMPLCMQQIHKGLQRDGKIRHWARLQYGLFLKGAGLSMEESLRFFQAKFHALTSPDQFNKEYAYNIRHMYGKEGKRANYTPYSCTKIILGNAPPVTREDHHGCPFRHCDDANLSRLLWDHVKLHNSKTAATAPPMVAPDAANRAAIQEILQLKRANHYQLACVKHFELLHPTNSRSKHASTAEVGNHPNAWLAASVAYSSISLNESQIDVPVKSSPDDLSQLVGQDNAVTEESMMMNEE